MLKRLRKRMAGKRRLQRAIIWQYRRISPFWHVYLPESRMREAEQIMRNIHRLDRLQIFGTPWLPKVGNGLGDEEC